MGCYSIKSTQRKKEKKPVRTPISSEVFFQKTDGIKFLDKQTP